MHNNSRIFGTQNDSIYSENRIFLILSFFSKFHCEFVGYQIVNFACASKCRRADAKLSAIPTLYFVCRKHTVYRCDAACSNSKLFLTFSPFFSCAKQCNASFALVVHRRPILQNESHHTIFCTCSHMQYFLGNCSSFAVRRNM